jgi:hypothetical protein
MALRGDRLTRGASLARVSIDAARSDATANIRSGAALLGALADELWVNRADLAAWAPAVAAFSGIQSQEGQAMYVHSDVYSALRSGIEARSPAGNLMVSGGGAQRVARLREAVHGVVDGVRAGLLRLGHHLARIAQLQHAQHGDPLRHHPHLRERLQRVLELADQHVVRRVRALRGERERVRDLAAGARGDKAWHIGANYDCANNGGHDCQNNGIQANNLTIGIEHGGYASSTSWPVGQIDASAKLSCDISKEPGDSRATATTSWATASFSRTTAPIRAPTGPGRTT